MKYLSLILLTTLILMGCKESTKNKDDSPPIIEKSMPVEPTKLKNSVFPSVTTDFSLDYLMGKIDPKMNQDFTKIASEHASKSGMYMRKDAYSAFVKMYEAAKKEGVSLKIVSATRPYSHQKSIWEAKWSGARKVDGQDLSKTISNPKTRALKILEYSSMPGTSRHHWGTDIDLNNLNNEYFESGKGAKIYAWLGEHATEFGFCQPYSTKGTDRPHGYEEEKWHWSYTPVSKQLTRLYQQKISDESITGFEGAKAAQSIGILEKFVLGISPVCK